MYFAIEGIKGSGKSTVFERAFDELRRCGLAVQAIRPTAARPACWIDAIHQRFGQWWPDWMSERVYAARSNQAAENFHRRGCILGERSVLTSYVSRWNDCDPVSSMDRVDRLECRLPLPRHVLFLSVPVELALRRIQDRARRGYGLCDQSEAQLRRADKLYRHLAMSGAYYGLGDLQWHWIDATELLGVVVSQVVGIVKQIEFQPRCQAARDTRQDSRQLAGEHS